MMPSVGTTTGTPVAPRRGRPPRISQDQIVDAAIGLGLATFTMQGIAEELGVTAPALYSHVAGREDVLDLVNATLRARLAGSGSDATDWRAWLIDFAHAVRTHLGPSAAAFIADARGRASAEQLGAGERGLQLLIEEGLSPAEAGYAMWLVFRVAVTAGPRGDTDFAGFVADTGAVLAPAAGTEHAATRAVHAALVTAGPHDTFAFDLEIVLDGIACRLATRDPRRKDHP